MMTEDLELTDFPLEDPYRRHLEATRAAEFGATYRQLEPHSTHSYAAITPGVFKAREVMLEELPGYDERAAIREALADKIEREVAPVAPESWIGALPLKLRSARRSGLWGLRLSSGRPIVYWDAKAGLSRLCPDDAREEAMRLRRRMEPTLVQLQESGHRLTYAVFTLPNFEPGRLLEGMREIFERFRRVVLKSGEFPQIKGALCVLEAPLGEHRDWNVHLNALLVTDGFVDWSKIRRLWHWNVHLRTIKAAPGAIGAAMTELIKYAVAATVAKSADHSAGGRSRAPPMLQWHREELLEWLRAFHGFRRTRSYACLYKLEEPEREVEQILWLGSVGLRRGRYWLRVPLLDSIPEDNSTGGDPRRRLEAILRTLAPGGIPGAGRLGEYVQREVWSVG